MQREEIRAKMQQKVDSFDNWQIAGNNGFIPKRGEFIVYQDSDRTKLKIGDGNKTVNKLPFFTEGVGQTTYNATPENIIEVIGNALPNSIIQLEPGDYPLLTLTNEYGFTTKDLYGEVALKNNNGIKNSNKEIIEKARVTMYPKNLTIRGCDGAEIKGISLTSGVQSHQNTLTDLSFSTLSGGLTFEKVRFTKPFSLRNAQIDGLSFTGCEFLNSNIVIKSNDFEDIYGKDVANYKGGLALNRRGKTIGVMTKNILIKNCTIDVTGLRGPEYDDNNNLNNEGYILAPPIPGIHLFCIDCATISENIIIEPICNGIRIEGYYLNGNFDIPSTGKIIINNNNIKNTKLENTIQNSVNCKNTDIYCQCLEDAQLSIIKNNIQKVSDNQVYINIGSSNNLKTFFGSGTTANTFNEKNVISVKYDENIKQSVIEGYYDRFFYRKWSNGVAEIWYQGKSSYTDVGRSLPFHLVEIFGCFANNSINMGETIIYSPYATEWALYTKTQINGVIQDYGKLNTPIYIIGKWK